MAEGDSNEKAVKSERGIENRKGFGGRTLRGKDSQLDTRRNDVKTAESCGPHFEVSYEKLSHTRHEAVKTKLTNKHN